MPGCTRDLPGNALDAALAKVQSCYDGEGPTGHDALWSPADYRERDRLDAGRDAEMNEMRREWRADTLAALARVEVALVRLLVPVECVA